MSAANEREHQGFNSAGHGKPWSFHGSSPLSKPLRGCVGWSRQLWLTFQDVGLIVFTVFSPMGKTLALKESPPATAVNVKPCLKLRFGF